MDIDETNAVRRRKNTRTYEARHNSPATTAVILHGSQAGPWDKRSAEGTWDNTTQQTKKKTHTKPKHKPPSSPPILFLSIFLFPFQTPRHRVTPLTYPKCLLSFPSPPLPLFYLLQPTLPPNYQLLLPPFLSPLSSPFSTLSCYFTCPQFPQTCIPSPSPLTPFHSHLSTLPHPPLHGPLLPFFFLLLR